MRPILFAPHNDDEVLFASFLILRYQPHVIVCYRSAVQEENGITAEERERESLEALAELGHAELLTQWPWRDDADCAEEIEGNMGGLLDPVSEDVPQVFAPASHPRGHPQHNLIAELADKVYGPENVIHYTTYVYGGPRHVTRNEIRYETHWISLKLRALSCYRSQFRAGPHRMWMDFGLREYLG